MKLYKTAAGGLYLVTADNTAHKQIRDQDNPYGPPVYWNTDAGALRGEWEEIPLDSIAGIEYDGSNTYKTFAVIKPNFWRYSAAVLLTRSGYLKLIIEGIAEEGLEKGRSFSETQSIPPEEFDDNNRFQIINKVQQAAALDHWKHTGKTINYPQDIDLYMEKNGELFWFEVNLF